MGYRKPKASIRSNLNQFKAENEPLIADTRLPYAYVETEAIWIDFLEHGFIDQHPDLIPFSVDDMNALEYLKFLALTDRYFANGFEYFSPMAITNHKDFLMLREKYELR